MHKFARDQRDRVRTAEDEARSSIQQAIAAAYEIERNVELRYRKVVHAEEQRVQLSAEEAKRETRILVERFVAALESQFADAQHRLLIKEQAVQHRMRELAAEALKTTQANVLKVEKADRELRARIRAAAGQASLATSESLERASEGVVQAAGRAARARLALASGTVQGLAACGRMSPINH